MAYLNREAREKLVHDLSSMNFNQAKGKLRRMDAKGKLVFLRNAQNTGEYQTRYDLYGLGITVTLVEREVSDETVATDKPGAAAVRTKPVFQLAEVIVDPMPDNQS